MTSNRLPQAGGSNGPGSGGGGGGGKRRSGRRRDRSRQGSAKHRVMDVPNVSPEGLELLHNTLDLGQYIVFDIETTGGNPEKNGITEIFAIRYRGGEVLETFYSLVNPGIPIPPIVRRMTGINNQMVRSAPRIDAVMPDVVKFIAGDVLVSHNTIGDMKFIRHFAKAVCDIDLENFYLCTHLLVEKLAPEAPDKSLKGLADHFKLAQGELHRAEADAYVTLELFKVLLGRLKSRSVRRIDEAVRLQGDLESAMRLGWGIDPAAFDRIPAGPGVFKLRDHEGRMLFLSGAAQLHREVAKLRAFQQLPRQLLRLVLKAYAIDAEETSSGFSALLAEATHLAAEQLNFDPAGWHQRTVQTIYIAEGDGGKKRAEGAAEPTFHIGIGPLAVGTVWAFGPVRDRRIAGEFLDAVAAAFAVPMGRRGMTLPAAALPELLALFGGGVDALLKEVQRERRNIRLWFRPRERQELTRKLQRLKSLVALGAPQRMQAVRERTGVLLVRTTQGEFEMHRVVRLCPVGSPEIFAENPEQQLRQGGLGQGIAQELTEARRLAETSPLVEANVHHANTILWWLFNVRNDSKFIPVHELFGGSGAGPADKAAAGSPVGDTTS